MVYIDFSVNSTSPSYNKIGQILYKTMTWLNTKKSIDKFGTNQKNLSLACLNNIKSRIIKNQYSYAQTSNCRDKIDTRIL